MMCNDVPADCELLTCDGFRGVPGRNKIIT